MHMLDIPMDSLPYGGRRAADSIGPVPLLTPGPSVASSLSKHHEISPSCADHEHGVCRHAHVPNSHSPEASASPCGRAPRKDEGCAVSPHPGPRPGPVGPLYARATCTRVSTRALLPRFFERQLAFQNSLLRTAPRLSAFLFTDHVFPATKLHLQTCDTTSGVTVRASYYPCEVVLPEVTRFRVVRMFDNPFDANCQED